MSSCVLIVCSFLLPNDSPLCESTTYCLFIQLSLNIGLCFWFRAIIKKKNCYDHSCVGFCFPFCWGPAAESHGASLFGLIRNCKTIFQSDSTICVGLQGCWKLGVSKQLKFILPQFWSRKARFWWAHTPSEGSSWEPFLPPPASGDSWRFLVWAAESRSLFLPPSHISVSQISLAFLL